MEDLKGKIAIVTGGARGIGRAIVSELMDDGCDVIIFDKSFPPDYEENCKENTDRSGKQIITRQLDITKTDEVTKAIDELHAQHEHIDILVNNAGITRDRLIIRMTEEDWDAVLAVNLKGTFNTIKAIAKHMAKQRFGKIINITSVVGLMGNFGQTNYAASKAGMIGLSKSIAKELASRNINVNCVAPGFVETEMTQQLSNEQRMALLNLVPLKRPSKPEEIAGIVAFLASEKASYITGQVISVDGGMVM